VRKGPEANVQTLRFSLSLGLGALLLEAIMRERSEANVQSFRFSLGLRLSALLLEAVVRERSISNVQPLGFGISTLLLESVVGKRTVADVQALSLCVAGDLIVLGKRPCALHGCILTAGTATGAASAPATSRVDKTKHFMVTEDRESFWGVLNTSNLDG
jgi:hypothetical protein